MSVYSPTDGDFTAVTYEVPGPFGSDVRTYIRTADAAEAEQWIAAIGNMVPLDVVQITGGTVEVLSHHEPTVVEPPAEPAPEEPAPEPAPDPAPAPTEEPAPEPAPEQPQE